MSDDKLNHILLWGLGLLIFGVFYVWRTWKYGEKDEDFLKLNLQAYIIGALCIIAGMASLLKYLFGRL
jgi:hypothetical protein